MRILGTTYYGTRHITTTQKEVRSPADMVELAGTRLHVAVRGQDVLATFTVARGTDGVTLTHLADTPCGQWPRHHAVLPGGTSSADVVVVAAQGSHELVAIEIGADGSGRELSRLTLPVRPSCVVPV